MSPSSVPPQAPSSGRPLPIRRVLWGEFPDLIGTISRLRLLASPRASLRFLRSALPPLRPPSLPRSRTNPRGPGPLLSRRPRRLSTVEKTRSPRFLDDPCVHAPLFDPGGPPAPGHYRDGDVVFRLVNDVDSAIRAFEALSRGLHALCVRFAAGVTPGPRTTRFRLVANLVRSGLSPAGSRRGFPSCLSVYMASSPHQALPGAITTHPCYQRHARRERSEWPPAGCNPDSPWTADSLRFGNRLRRTCGCGSILRLSA